jgi:hypothetical protein
MRLPRSMGEDDAALAHLPTMQDRAGVVHISRGRKHSEEIATVGGTCSTGEKRPGVVSLGSTGGNAAILMSFIWEDKR